MNPVRRGPAEEFQLRLHCVRQTHDKGRAIFALTDIPKNALILEVASGRAPGGRLRQAR